MKVNKGQRRSTQATSGLSHTSLFFWFCFLFFSIYYMYVLCFSKLMYKKNRLGPVSTGPNHHAVKLVKTSCCQGTSLWSDPTPSRLHLALPSPLRSSISDLRSETTLRYVTAHGITRHPLSQSQSHLRSIYPSSVLPPLD